MGLVIFAKYHACDPVKLGLIKQSDQVCKISHIETRGKKTNTLVCSIALSIVRHGNVKAFQRFTRYFSRLCIQWCFKVSEHDLDSLTELIICSTLSSGLNSLAAVVLSDIIKFFYRKEMTDKQDLRYSKILCKSSERNPLSIFLFSLALVFGVVCILVTYLVSLLGNLLQATLSLFGVLSGPISAIFMIGFFLPWVNSMVKLKKND